ncbi:MAG: sulfotransferase, partial [Saprospiraceae bacterium]|nr:sulfotransferase [Saprospiraceae bacterium]
MALEVLGVGFGRTGTHSLKLALEHLGYPCYHMENLINHPDDLHYWSDARAGKDVDWDALFASYRAAVDFPAIMHWETFVHRYPQAKCILTTRDTESWYRSFGDTIIRQSRPSLGQML